MCMSNVRYEGMDVIDLIMQMFTKYYFHTVQEKNRSLCFCQLRILQNRQSCDVKRTVI